MFLLRKNIKNINSFVSRGLYTLMLRTYVRHICFCSILIILSGDIKKNSRPKPSSRDKFYIYIYRCNLNSISVHNLIKIYLLHSITFVCFNFDILWLSETYLDSSTSRNDNNLTLPDYDLYRADHPSNARCVCVCVRACVCVCVYMYVCVRVWGSVSNIKILFRWK